MINLVKNQNPMPEQAPDVRNKNFLEVAEGYTEQMAINEAMRCLKCRKRPCVSGCPVNIKIPDFIAQVAIGEFEEAYRIISEDSSLPAICGRVCPQENQCQGECVRCAKGEPVAIGRLERFVADWHAANYGDEEIKPVDSNGHKVAIIGAGPAGLACAGDLVNKGYEVTVFEALHKTGGVLVYGIPQFRLPKEIVAAEVAKLEAKGVKFVTDAVVGRAITVDELMKEEGFESVFIGTGAGLPSFMNIPGENLIGVCSANEYLTRINLMHGYEFPKFDTPAKKANKVVVIGGGGDKRRNGVSRTTGGEKRATLVARERSALAIRRVKEGVGVRLGSVGVTAELHERVALEVVRRSANLARLPDDGGGGDDGRPITVLIGGARRLECLLIHDAPSLGDLRYARSCSIRTELMTSPARSSEMTSKPSTQVPKTVYPLSRPCWGPRQK